jgi:restriction system protein
MTLTPREFELAVKGILDGSGLSLKSYESAHLNSLTGVDGEYVIDVTARFSALGADFLVLVECKHQKRKTERQQVQVLLAKVKSVGAHKGMIFSTSGFQAGAIQYADTHGIALVQLASGETTWFSRSLQPTPPPAWANIPKYVGWWHHANHMSVLSATKGEYTREALGIET